VIEGLLKTGCEVHSAGIQMTPTVGCVIDRGHFIEDGVVVTASHNPQEWNGIKLIVDGAAPPQSVASEIIEMFQSGAIHSHTRRGTRKEYTGAANLHRVEVGDELQHSLGHYLHGPTYPKPIWGVPEPTLLAVVDSVN